MSNRRVLIGSAIASVVAMGLMSAAGAQPAAKPNFAFEKCYGVTKAGKNDCQTSNTSCAGTSKTDARGDAWLYLPKGSCEKIVGASLTPKG